MMRFRIVGIVYLSANGDFDAYLAVVIYERTHPIFFNLLFILLPIVGFPIVVFRITKITSYTHAIRFIGRWLSQGC